MTPLTQPDLWAEAQAAIPPWFGPLVAFIFGATVGSFLNVCIHRLPKGESIVAPRSHCCACGHMIRWHDNIPLVSYFALGGKCRDCGAWFSIRYWVIELLTAILFSAIWHKFGIMEAAAYTIFACGLIIATFIDFELFIIPDEITLGGVAAGLLCSVVVPSLQQTDSRLYSLLWSLGGAAVGYLALWAVVEAGKRAFGTKKETFAEPAAITLTKEGIRIGETLDSWDEIFSRPTDQLIFEATGARYGERSWPQVPVRVDWQTVHLGEEAFPLETFAEFNGTTKEIVVPREAMGFGDVKLLAGIGAFLGPQAIFFVILVSSIFGSLVGVSLIASGKKHWGMKLPYGPYLAVAALAWILGGAYWASQYWEWLRGG
jgi:leader peptidase (prepilin peptidase)/N-methyltransferase